MNIFEKAKAVLTEPIGFFKQIKKEPLSFSINYLAIFSLIGIVLQEFLNPDATETIRSMLDVFGINAATYFESILLSVIIVWVITFFVSVVIAGYVQLFVKLLGGKGTYSDTFKASSYGATPSMLLAWVPYVGWLSILWAIYLETAGMSQLHKVSMMRGFAMLVVPFVSFIIFSALIGFIGFIVFFALTSGLS